MMEPVDPECEVREIEKEYREGLLTDKGYKRKIARAELAVIEKEYKNGDLTLQGYQKKKQKLSAELEAMSTSDEISTASSFEKKASSIASSLSDVSVHSTLMKLFKPKMDASGFNPSAISGNVSHGQKKSLQLARKKNVPSGKDQKPITVVLVPPDLYTVPKDKKKLRQERRMSCCNFSVDDSAEDVKKKVTSAFPNLKGDVVFLQTTKTGDLFKMDAEQEEFNDEKVLTLAGNGCLYVTSPSVDNSAKSQLAVSSSGPIQVVKPNLSKLGLPCANSRQAVSLSGPIQVVVKPNSSKLGLPQLVVVPKPSEVQESKECRLRETLFDDKLLYLIKCESMYHQPDKYEDDPASKFELNREKGEFFLALNMLVHLWLLKRKQDGLAPLREVDNFCVVNEKIIDEYESFKTFCNKNHLELLLPSSDLLIHYMEKNGIQIRSVDMFNERLIEFPPNRIDDICDWIEETRKKFYDIGLQVLK